MVWDVSTVSTMSTLPKSLISMPAEDTQNGYPGVENFGFLERNRRYEVDRRPAPAKFLVFSVIIASI